MPITPEELRCFAHASASHHACLLAAADALEAAERDQAEMLAIVKDTAEGRDNAEVAAQHAEAERDRYKQAILDLDANAAPMGEDRDGLIAGYYVTTAALHRALALVGDTTPRKARRTAGEESDA